MNVDKFVSENDDLFPLVLSKRFSRILKDIDDNISNELLELASRKEKFKETFIDRTDKEDMVTFLSSDKAIKISQDESIDAESEYWSSPQRIETRIGRLIVRLLGDKTDASDLEDFVNEYKSIITTKKLSRHFKIVDGDDIRKWYLSENYAEGGGNLRNSCMRHRFCQMFFDIYAHNPDKVKLLILLDDTRQRILGRALLWKLDRPENTFFMDRVYFSSDFILNMFVNHAIKHRWLYKLESMENVLEVVSNNTVKRETMIVKLKKEDHEYYPFVDNLCFYDPDSATLTNNPKYLKSIGCDQYYDLADHTGGYEIRSDFDF
jgi:hypothetical protein